MGMNKAAETLLEAAHLLKTDTQDDTASAHACMAADVLGRAEQKNSRQFEIKAEAAGRMERLKDKLAEMQGEVSSLAALLQEGARLGTGIKEDGQTAATHLASTEEQVLKAKDLVEHAGAMDSPMVELGFLVIAQNLSPLKSRPPVIEEVGERYARQYTAAEQVNDSLVGTFNLAAEQVTALLGKVGILGSPETDQDQVIMPRSLQYNSELALAIFSEALRTGEVLEARSRKIST